MTLKGKCPGNDPHRKYLADVLGLVYIVDQRRKFRPQFFVKDVEPARYIKLLSKEGHWRVMR